MMRRLLLLFWVALALVAAPVPLAAASPPQDVEITIDETYHASPPFVTGVLTAVGGVFGAGATGTLESIDWMPVGWAVRMPVHPLKHHVYVYTATDQYTFPGGTFLIDFEGSCIFTSFDPETGAHTAVCDGNWQVNGGTGDYARLKGVGTWIETQDLDWQAAGPGLITLLGTMHID
jgi:hypothetical protein